MFLEKWYGDFISNGCAEIRYLANLHFGPVIVGYNGKLGAEHSSSTIIGFRGFEIPLVRGDTLHWPANGNGTELIWKGVHRRPQLLWTKGTHTVYWEPMVLNGEVTLVGQPASPRRGYAERLTINFPPWRLGLKTLKWGRFCGQRHSLVWIKWQGRFNKQLALLDGDPTLLLAADRHAVRAQDTQLLIETPRQIVNQSLGVGTLHIFRWLPVFKLSRFLAGVETKWVAQGILTSAGGAMDQGTVLYEEVVWP